MKGKRAQTRMDELLSAYLDGELHPKQQARLETRLAANPDLQERLETLRHTVALVRDLPQVQAPRNFLLTPAMVGQAQPRRSTRRWLAPALSFATAASGLLCVVALAGGLLAGRMEDLRLAEPIILPIEEPYEVAEMTVAPGEAEAPQPVEHLPPPAAEEAAPAPTEEADLATGQGVTETLAAQEEPLPGGEPPPTATAWAEAAAAPPEDTVGASGGEATPTVSSSPTVALEGRAFVTATVPPPTAEADEENTFATNETVTPAAVAQAGDEASPTPVLSRTPIPEAREEPLGLAANLWPLPAGLALLTLGLAVASGLAWRARRR